MLDLDIRGFFGSLSHEWMLRFVERRVGDPRLISLIRRWLKADVLEGEGLHANEEGTPQGGSISVLLSNVYLRYVLDLWFERYGYYGIAGNIRALRQVHRAVERYWRKMLSSRSWKGEVRWQKFQRIKERFPLLRPKLHLPYAALQALAAL